MIKLLLNNQLDQLSEYMGTRLVSNIRYGQVNKFECYPQLNLISFDWYDITDENAEPAQIVIYFTQENIFFSL